VGLAQALIHNPQVLILDEPTSGLDPNQIVEIRNLIKEIGKEKTVMLSTHIMQEVEAICDRVIIINKGKIVADTPTSSLHQMSKDKETLLIEFSKPINREKLKAILGIGMLENKGGNNWEITTDGKTDIRPALFKLAVDQDATVLTLQKQTHTLEQVFRELTN
jgi:ABC-2 type transport system ATP-binding protein